MQKTRILIAEDDAHHRMLMERLLTRGRPSVEVTTASNRDELLEAASEGEFDCIILDYNIPPYTAPELISDLEGIQPDAPRIIVSSSDEQRVVIESLRLGVSDFIRKDEAVSRGTLWDRVSEAVEKAGRDKRERRRANRRIRALRKLAETDPLTGLSNRRFMENLIAETRRRGDRRSHVCFAMIDLDCFKSINDRFGHDVGDDALRAVASEIRAHVRGSDIACRWGGEEFVVLRQIDSYTDGWLWADELRRRIERGVSVPGSDRPVTVSVGVDVMPTKDLHRDAMVRADQAMYLAKRSGRNRVCTWPMVRATDEASDLRNRDDLTPRQRLIELVGKLTDELGETQLDHIGPHGRRVRELAMRAVSGRPMTGESIEALRLAAEFHDIGKIGIPESLLAAPRRLTSGERRFVDEHARFGAELFRACGASEEAASAVEDHHTRFDEASGQRVRPALGHILSACDAIDAMTSHRAYALPRTKGQALEELESERGAQFHPEVVDSLRIVSETTRARAA